MDEAQFLSLPEAQRKAIQQQLQAQGLYAGPIDGKSGAGTRAALEAAKEAKAQAAQRQQEMELEKLRLQNQGKTNEAKAALTTAEAQAKTAETERLKQYNEQAGSPEGIATKIAAGVGAPAAGAAAGWGLGKGVNAGMDAAQRSRNEVLRRTAGDRLAGITTREGAREGARLAGAMPMQSTVARSLGRMAPHMGLGALSIGKGAATLMDDNENTPFYADMANKAAGLGYIGLGAGLAKQGINYAGSPGVAPDAQSIAIINSNQLRRNGAPGGSALSRALSGQTIDAEVLPDEPRKALPSPPQAPAASTPNPGTKAYMYNQARDLGIKGASRMNKSQLSEALSQAVQEHGGKRTVGKRSLGASVMDAAKKGGGKAAIPLAVGAYMAGAGDSEAADGSMGERAGNAAANFGTGAGAAYGGMKLSDLLAKAAPNVMRGLGSGAAMAMPGEMIGGMTDQFASPEARNIAARYLPEALQFGAVDEAREMATVPPPSPANSGPRSSRLSEGAPFAPNIQGRLQRMISTGASPDQVAAFLNQAVR